jgi:hypothetical protein
MAESKHRYFKIWSSVSIEIITRINPLVIGVFSFFLGYRFPFFPFLIVLV